jgi:hypothetical protein
VKLDFFSQKNKFLVWTNYERDCSIVAMDKGEYFECLVFSSGSYGDDNYLHNLQIVKPENDSLEIFNRVKLYVKSPCLHPIFRPAFTPYPLFQLYPQSTEILLNLRFSI